MRHRLVRGDPVGWSPPGNTALTRTRTATGSGPTNLQLPVNAPKAPVHSYNKDGAMRYRNPGDPVYAPNSYGGPAANPELWKGGEYHVAGEIVRSASAKQHDDDEFVQPHPLYEPVMTKTGRGHPDPNIDSHANGRGACDDR